MLKLWRLQLSKEFNPGDLIIVRDTPEELKASADSDFKGKIGIVHYYFGGKEYAVEFYNVNTPEGHTLDGFLPHGSTHGQFIHVDDMELLNLKPKKLSKNWDDLLV